MWVRQALLSLFLLVCPSQAHLVNITIDDTYGDFTTGQKPVYQPVASSWYGPEACNQNPAACFILPNTSLAFDRTWTASGAPEVCRNITISFTG
jgi:hypothetical protein